jgi:hypothetical protein
MRMYRKCVYLALISAMAVTSLTACQSDDTIGESQIVLNPNETVKILPKTLVLVTY